MRLIDADALIDRLDYCVKEGLGSTIAFTFKHMVEDAPTIDAVSVVRCAECKNCKRKRTTFKGEPIIFYRCKEHNRDVESDDYCSWGEREGE